MSRNYASAHSSLVGKRHKGILNMTNVLYLLDVISSETYENFDEWLFANMSYRNSSVHVILTDSETIHE